MVRRMNDGGMGSLRFEPKTDEQRVFGGVLAEAQFLDRDGVSVCAAINLDKAGNLYELDLWKVDNSALIDFPEPSEITLISKSSEL